MIQFFLLQNRQGKTRLTKWYITPPDDAERIKQEKEIHRVVSIRSRSHTNFVEFKNYKLVYRRYAGLYFTFGVDLNDNVLLLMETIHHFVELLDEYFANVCEVSCYFCYSCILNFNYLLLLLLVCSFI